MVSRRPMARISRGNALMLSSLVAFPLTWLGAALVGGRRLRHPWRAAVVAGPLCGHAAVACWEQIDRVRHAKLQWRRLARSNDLLEGLREQRAAVVTAVDDALGAPASAITAPAAAASWPRPTTAPIEGPAPPEAP
jgi:hypothetical protein